MKSGLEGRNNFQRVLDHILEQLVSMKSGLEGRNNELINVATSVSNHCLNEVRPRRPEQSDRMQFEVRPDFPGLNEVRPRRPEQWVFGADPIAPEDLSQ